MFYTFILYAIRDKDKLPVHHGVVTRMRSWLSARELGSRWSPNPFFVNNGTIRPK